MNLTSKDISDEFPNSGKIYLNNASVSLMPQISIDAMRDFLLNYNSVGPDSSESESFVNDCLHKARKTISKIIHCQPDEVVFTQSTTDGVNIVANGLSFSKDSSIIIRGLSHEHHANFFPWLRLKEKINLKNLSIDKDGFFQFEELKKFLEKKVTLVALSHALYNTGAIIPLEEVDPLLPTETLFFVDSAQTVGCIGDYDFSKINYDFMSFNGSKWLCGPMGTGLFVCKRKSSEFLEPSLIGGESAMVYDENNLAFKNLPDKFQTGFRNYVGIVGMETSANYLLKFGLDNIRKKNIRLADFLRSELEMIPNLTLYGPNDSDKRTSIVSFTIKGKNPKEIIEKLEKQKIILAVREIFEKKIVRISPHFFNTEEEIHKVIDAIKRL